MSNVALFINSIEQKVRKLAGQQQVLENELENRKKEVIELLQRNREQKETIIQLEEKIRNLTISKTIESKKDAVEAKNKINELVREIDKCIGLLNT
jgi:hypothetical protein